MATLPVLQSMASWSVASAVWNRQLPCLCRLQSISWRGFHRGANLCTLRNYALKWGPQDSDRSSSSLLFTSSTYSTKVLAAASDVAILSPDLAFSVSGKRGPSELQNPNEWAVEYTRLLPCPPGQLPPRVEHMILKQSGNVVDVVSEALALPPLYVEDLVDFGAIHYALLCPAPPPTATPKQFELYKKFSLLQDHSKRPSLKGKTVREAQKTYRLLRKDKELEEGTYLRVHVHPKRSPRCYEVDWKRRILAETKSYVVLDKPAGVSVGGTVDNLEETCAMFAARALGMSSPLFLTHQIDTCTEGCVVLAKTKEFSSKFHTLLRERMVKKLYRALSTAPVPIGVITHFMRYDRLPPRLVSKEAHDGWQICQMEIFSCKLVPWPSPSTMGRVGIKDCGWKTQSHAYECTLRLLTGRTHQVRTQFAALNAPLVGDSMYIPATIARLKFPDVDPLLNAPIMDNEESWVGNVKDRKDAVVMARWVAMHGKEPDCGLGLQASQISWEDDEIHTFQPGAPWWEA
ncbi:unnamed protein product [Calypogeia fissa]